MTTLEKKIEVVLLRHIFMNSYIEDLKENHKIELTIADARYCIRANYDEKTRQLTCSLTKEPDTYQAIIECIISCSPNIKKEGFILFTDVILNGYLKCFLEGAILDKLKIDSSLFTATLQTYFEKEGSKIIFFLEKSLGRDIKQRKIDNPKEKIYNEDGIEFCAVLNECLQRMYFDQDLFIKKRRDTYIEDDTVNDVYDFMRHVLLYLIGDIGFPYFSSSLFLKEIQNQLNRDKSDDNENNWKLEYLLFLCTCLNEVPSKAFKNDGAIYKQIEYTYKKEIAEAILFCYHYYLRDKLGAVSMDIEDVLQEFYIKTKESERKQNGKIIQKISKLFRGLS